MDTVAGASDRRPKLRLGQVVPERDPLNGPKVQATRDRGVKEQLAASNELIATSDIAFDGFIELLEPAKA